jgi:hypothetical protein
VWTVGDLFIPGLAAVLALYYLYTIKGLPGLAQMYGGTLSIVCLLFFTVALYLVFSDRRYSDEKTKNTFAVKYAKFICMIFLTAFFIFILPYAGYFLSTTLLGILIAGYLHYSKSFLILLTIGLIISLSGFFLFVLFLDVDLPLDSISLAAKEAIHSWWR